MALQWYIERLSIRDWALSLLEICIPLLFSLSYLLTWLRRRHASTADYNPDPHGSGVGLSLFFQGFLSCALILDLATNFGLDEPREEGVTYRVLHNCGLASAILACIPVAHSLLYKRFRTPRMFYYLAMVGILYGKIQLSGPLMSFSTLGSIAAYFFTFLGESQIFRISRKSLNAYEDRQPANFFDRCTFSWLSFLVHKGLFGGLAIEDLPVIPKDILPPLGDPGHLTSDNGSVTGFWTFIIRECPKEFFLSLLFELTDIICKFSLPWILRAFLRELKPSIIMAFFVISVVDTVVTVQAAFQLRKAGAKMKATIVCHLYDKLLKIPINREDSGVSIVNLMEVDTQRLQDFMQYIHAVWSAPLQIAACMGGIAIILGGTSTAAAILSMLVFLPIFHGINMLQHRFQLQIMVKRDVRLSLTSEIIRNIKGVKLLNLLEPLGKKADGARRGELFAMQKASWLTAASNVILRSAPTLSSVAAFYVASVSEVNMSVDALFSALLFFGMLTYPLSLLPAVVVYWAGSKASYQRVREFIEQHELPPDAYQGAMRMQEEGPVRLEIQEVSYKWEKGQSSSHGLSDITLSIGTGELIALDGDMGTGKTTFLNICLGAIQNCTGRVTVRGSLAYMPQNSWLKAGSIRDNILFGRPYSTHFYLRVTNACALEQDFQDLEKGDETHIDTVGSGLSGGQKARIMLARMVYSDADIYLMDDPLAALDSKTKARIVEDVIGPRGLLKDKVRVVTSSIDHIRLYAHRILTIHNGSIFETTPEHLVVSTQSSHVQSNDTLVKVVPLCDRVQSIDKDQPTITITVDEEPISGASLLSQIQVESKKREPTQNDNTPRFGVYTRFFAYAGLWAWVAVIITIMTGYAANASSTYVLKLASAAVGRDLQFLLAFYAFCCVTQAFLIFMWLMMAWFLCNYPTSLKLHSNLMGSILRSPMSFFRDTPSGEILNRFTNDMARADTPIYAVLYGLFNAGTRTLSTLAIIAIFSPVSIIYLVPFLLTFWYLQRSYIRVAVQLRELDTLSRGSLVSGIVEAEAGQWIIRTFNQVHEFTLAQRQRIDRNMTAYYASFSLEQWLILRTGMLSSLIIGICPIILIYTSADPATVGMVMNFILQLSGSLAITAVLGSQLESEMVSVRRILEYCDIEPEGSGGKHMKLPPAAWPTTGNIELENVTASYGPGLQPAICNVSLSIRSGEKIGIVGRTGAGKSSLASALLGFLDLESGTIYIDNVDITTLDVNELRGRVSTIPQEPIAFRGTVRDNLDPEGEFDTSDLLRVLQDSYFSRGFSNPNEALEFCLADKGSNLSSGQLQLLAIARCLLHNSRVLLLDEATASVDNDTEELILRTIRENFRDRTVITIAHRLQTILDSDRVVVMDKGEIVEVGTPIELYERGATFRQLVDEAGLAHLIK